MFTKMFLSLLIFSVPAFAQSVPSIHQVCTHGKDASGVNLDLTQEGEHYYAALQTGERYGSLNLHRIEVKLVLNTPALIQFAATPSASGAKLFISFGTGASGPGSIAYLSPGKGGILINVAANCVLKSGLESN